MKFLFFQISIVSASLNIQNSSVLSDTYNMTPFLGVNNSYVLTPDNILPNLSRKENFVTEHSSGRRKVRRNAKSSRKVSGDSHFDDNLLKKLTVDIYDKISAIKNIKSLLEKTNNSEKFYIDKFFRNVQEFIKYGKIKNSDDPLSIFFESLARETYHLLFLVVDLSSADKEEDKNKLKEELLNTLDVKFKDEKNLEVKQFFDKEKMIKFLDNLTLRDKNTNGVSKITKLISEFKSKIRPKDGKNNLTSTSGSIFYRKLVFNTNTTEIATESLTTEIPATLNVKPHKICKNKEKLDKEQYGVLSFLVGLCIFIVLCCFCCFNHCK